MIVKGVSFSAVSILNIYVHTWKELFGIELNLIYPKASDLLVRLKSLFVTYCENFLTMVAGFDSAATGLRDNRST